MRGKALESPFVPRKARCFREARGNYREFLTLCVFFILSSSASAADWPMYRADPARSGYTPQPLDAPLSLDWVSQERHAPDPAWPSSERMPYDRAFQPVVAGGTLYYGTSSDGRVVARDARSGQTRWTFSTDAPVRFAPAVWRDRAYVAGDDGMLYCLAAADGRICWKLRGGPRPDMLLGNDRMISRWPARGGPVVADGLVYFGAGIWPSEGIFVYALDALTGKRLWCNDTSGNLDLPQPHPTAQARSGIAAQGYLALSATRLLVPTGRAVPASLDRESGKFQYLELQPNRAEGGSDVAVIDEHFVNGGSLFQLATGAMETPLGVKVGKKSDAIVHNYTRRVEVAAHPRWIFFAARDELIALDRRQPLVAKPSRDRRGKPIEIQVPARPLWSATLPVPLVTALIAAADRVVAGAKDRVFVVDAASGRVLWQSEVQGTVYGLAAADGRLYASTDQGSIYCFGRAGAKPVTVPPAPPGVMPAVDPRFVQAAEEVLRRTGVKDGYCLDLGCGDGQLTLELARRSRLRVYAVDADPANVRAARERLDAAGLYGPRASVHHAAPGRLAYPDYFADLVVSGRSVVEGPQAVRREAIARFQRPHGGQACVGIPGAMQQWARGALTGAADWTHQYADPANTLCSGDLLPRRPLEMLWFRQTDLPMPSRHGRGPAPLVSQGRMYVEGLDALRAVNIYNGATLWQTPLAGVLRANHQDHLTGVAATGSNVCLGGERLFVRAEGRCLVLDAKTGRRLAQWNPPPASDGATGPWGYIAWADGTLFGSIANAEHTVKESWRTFLGKLDMTRLLSESTMLFALDATTGRLKWTYTAEHSVRHNAIAIGAGRVYLIDRPLASGDTARRTAARAEQAPGRLVCLDAATGRTLWRADGQGFGTMLALSTAHDVLLMAYQASRFPLDSELGGRMAAWRASRGAKLWDVDADYRSRPILIDRAIYAEPGKWDLLTGEELPFEFTRSYGCGILAASERLLVYRSATLGYRDLETGSETENYGGIRPGCWINAIPAGGLVLMADAASWCTCSYLNQATIALAPARRAPGGP